MAIYTVAENHLARIEVNALRSFPSVVFSFTTSGTIQKSKSKIMAGLRSIIRVPSKKYVLSITPGRLKYTHTHMESALAGAILKAIIQPKQEQDLLITGELDAQGNLIPITSQEWPQIIYSCKLNTKQPDILVHPESSLVDLSYKGKTLGCRNVYDIKRWLNNTEEPLSKHPGILVRQSNYRTKVPDIPKHYLEKVNHIRFQNFHTVICGPNQSGKSFILRELANYIQPLTTNEYLFSQAAAKDESIAHENPIPHTNRPIYYWQANDNIYQLVSQAKIPPYSIICIENLQHLNINQIERLFHYINNHQVVNPLTNQKVYYQVLSTVTPCPCGNLLSKSNCTCHSTTITNFQQRVLTKLQKLFHITIVHQDSYRLKDNFVKTKPTKSLQVSQTNNKTLPLGARMPSQMYRNYSKHLNKDRAISWQEQIQLAQLVESFSVYNSNRKNRHSSKKQLWHKANEWKYPLTL